MPYIKNGEMKVFKEAYAQLEQNEKEMKYLIDLLFKKIKSLELELEAKKVEIQSLKDFPYGTAEMD